MNDRESAVIAHYQDSNLLNRILTGLSSSGANIENLKPEDLIPVEEFHIGGRAATEHLVAKLALRPEDHVLDVGCGIGGAARYIASKAGSHVTGIDLTPEYIVAAKELSKRVSLDDKLRFENVSALTMPFNDACFDAALTVHVAMNIADRVSFYAEIARVMKPGAVFGLFDVMRKKGGDLVFPVPWAQSSATSHLTTAQETIDLLSDAGFVVTETEDRTDFALNFFARSMAAQAGGPPPLGTHLLMGDTAPVKFANILANIESELVAPVQIIATRREV